MTLKTEYCREYLGIFDLEEVPKFDNSRVKFVILSCFGVCYDRNTSPVFSNF